MTTPWDYIEYLYEQADRIADRDEDDTAHDNRVMGEQIDAVADERGQREETR